MVLDCDFLANGHELEDITTVFWIMILVPLDFVHR